jgi:hypothetical protein
MENSIDVNNTKVTPKNDEIFTEDEIQRAAEFFIFLLRHEQRIQQQAITSAKAA